MRGKKYVLMRLERWTSVEALLLNTRLPVAPIDRSIGFLRVYPTLKALKIDNPKDSEYAVIKQSRHET